MVAVSGSTREIRPRLKGINGPTQGCSELLSNLMLFLITSAGLARPGPASSKPVQLSLSRSDQTKCPHAER